MKKREIAPAPPERRALASSGRIVSGRSFGGRVGAARAGAAAAASAVERGALRIDLGAGKGALDPFGHDPVAGIEPGFDDPQLTLPVARS